MIRLAVPETGRVIFHDAIRGDITFDNARLQDAVLLKSDSWPTYHLANVVDDHLMAITHIIARGRMAVVGARTLASV